MYLCESIFHHFTQTIYLNHPMIVIRNTFQLKYGKAKDAKAIIAQMRANGGMKQDESRVLTDVTGPFYTMVLEFTAKDLASWEASQQQDLANPALRPLFQQFSELVETGNREIYTVVE
jgi:hypothetical protein